MRTFFKKHRQILIKWMFRAYVVWSLSLDISIVAGLVYYFFIR